MRFKEFLDLEESVSKPKLDASLYKIMDGAPAVQDFVNDNPEVLKNANIDAIYKQFKKNSFYFGFVAPGSEEYVKSLSDITGNFNKDFSRVLINSKVTLKSNPGNPFHVVLENNGKGKYEIQLIPGEADSNDYKGNGKYILTCWVSKIAAAWTKMSKNAALMNANLAKNSGATASFAPNEKGYYNFLNLTTDDIEKPDSISPSSSGYEVFAYFYHALKDKVKFKEDKKFMSKKATRYGVTTLKSKKENTYDAIADKMFALARSKGFNITDEENSFVHANGGTSVTVHIGFGSDQYGDFDGSRVTLHVVNSSAVTR